MELDYLRQVVVLSKTLNFSKTAERFYISQSTLSKHVKIVESEIGEPIFERDSHSVALSQSGIDFIEKAKKIICSYDELFSGRENYCEDTDVFALGYSDILREEWEDCISRNIKCLNKNATLKKRLINTTYALKLIKNNELDLAIVTFFPGAVNDPDINKKVLTRYPLTLVCPDDHPLSRSEERRVGKEC